MTIIQIRTLLLTLLLLSTSQLAFASDKLFSIYTPYTFATSALPYDTDQKVVNNDTSGKKFGIGVNIDYQKETSFFLEKLVVKDSSKDIYVSGIKFFPKESKSLASKTNDAETASSLKDKVADSSWPFKTVTYIMGVSRISQDETTNDVGKNVNRTGYNMVIGTDILALKSSYLHFVPLRVLFAFGQNGCNAFVSSEIGFSIPKF
jgi:hypothetical protein